MKHTLKIIAVRPGMLVARGAAGQLQLRGNHVPTSVEVGSDVVITVSVAEKETETEPQADTEEPEPEHKRKRSHHATKKK